MNSIISLGSLYYFLSSGRWLLVLCCALLVAVSANAADARSRSATPAPIVLALHPYANTPLRTLNVSIDRRIFPFIFDTGAGDTFITPQLLPEARCVPFGEASGFRADGTRLKFQRCGPVALRLGQLALSREVGVFDLLPLLGKGAPPVGGIIGLDSFAHDALTLDSAEDRIIIETPQSLKTRIKSMKPVVARITREPNGAVEVFLQARARTGTLWLELDTGNNGPVFLAPHAFTQLGFQPPRGKPFPLTLDISGFGAVPVMAAERPMIYDGELNPWFARKLVLTVDFVTDRVWAKWSTATRRKN